MADLTDDELLAELGGPLEQKKAPARTAREERIIAGFEDIQKFVEDHGRPPQHGEERDIFERLYAVRLDRMRALPECRDLLASMDSGGLLEGAEAAPGFAEDVDDGTLLAELGGPEPEQDITALTHVRSQAEKQAAEEIANRKRCDDFASFKPLFDAVARDLADGTRQALPIRKDAGFLKTDIKVGQFFILGGQTVYVAEVGEPIRAPNGEIDARLRAIFSNETESDLLLRSLTRALYKDEASRQISEPTAGPLFGSTAEDDDLPSGTIYVLSSKSDHPEIAARKGFLHKIGVTGGSVEARIANAVHDATYLLAEVQVEATYKLFNINRIKLEKIFHRVFGPAQLDITIPDRFGQPVRPREWFQAPLSAIQEAVERISDGSITDYVYDPKQARLVRSA